MLSIADQKAHLRQEMKQKRKQAAQTEVYAGEFLAKRLINWPQLAALPLVSCYWPMAGEINPCPFMEHYHKRGGGILLPVTDPVSSGLLFYPWYPEMALVKSSWGFMEPIREAKPFTPDIVILPLLAFDMQGNRLGYGKGHYDRTIIHLKTIKPILAVGIAYDLQQVPQVPHEPHDQKLDYVVTPSKIYEF